VDYAVSANAILTICLGFMAGANGYLALTDGALVSAFVCGGCLSSFLHGLVRLWGERP